MRALILWTMAVLLTGCGSEITPDDAGADAIDAIDASEDAVADAPIVWPDVTPGCPVTDGPEGSVSGHAQAGADAGQYTYTPIEEVVCLIDDPFPTLTRHECQEGPLTIRFDPGQARAMIPRDTVLTGESQITRITGALAFRGASPSGTQADIVSAQPQPAFFLVVLPSEPGHPGGSLTAILHGTVCSGDGIESITFNQLRVTLR